MSREDLQMKIRLPADLKDAIERESKLNKRSLNAEVVARLEQTLQHSLRPPGTVVDFDLSKVDPAVRKIYEAITLLDTSRERLRDFAEQELKTPSNSPATPRRLRTPSPAKKKASD
jgi:hypothetical protein